MKTNNTTLNFINLFTGLIFLMCACSSQSSSWDKKLISVEADSEKKHLLSEMIKVKSVVPVDSSINIGSIDKIKYVDGVYYVADFNNSRSLYLLDEEGQLIKSVSFKKDFYDFVVDVNKEYFHVICGRNFITYSRDAEVKEAKRNIVMPFFSSTFGMSGKDKFWFKIYSPDALEDHEIVNTDYSLKVQNKYHPFDKACALPHETPNCFGQYQDAMTFTRYFDPLVYIIKNDKIDRVLELDFGNKSIPVDYDHCSINPYDYNLFLDTLNMVSSIENVFGYSDMLFLNYTFKNTVHAVHYNLHTQNAYSYSLNKIQNNLFDGSFYFMPSARYSSDEFIFVHEPVYKELNPSNPELIVAQYTLNNDEINI